MPLPSVTELEPLIELCRKHGITGAQFGDVALTFGPARPAMLDHRQPTQEELEDDDPLESQRQKELDAWRRSRGEIDDPGIDG